jgi:Holliday junction resolvasome RuvABC endonuclease subunit
MKILALDIARKTGFCVGIAGAGNPRIWSESLAKKGEGYEDACGRLARTLRDWVRIENPDMLVIESWLHPLAQPSGDAAITQLHLHGVARAIAACKDIPIRMPTPAEVRVHFCGKASAVKRTKGPKTAAEKAEARKATKAMVINRAILLGYLPRDSKDNDAADAAALWDYACAHYARVQNSPLHMFNEAAQ